MLPREGEINPEAKELDGSYGSKPHNSPFGIFSSID